MSTPRLMPPPYIETRELLSDREACVNDIAWCKLALAAGVTHYSGGEVQNRIDADEKMVQTIDRLLAERQIHIVTPEEGS